MRSGMLPAHASIQSLRSWIGAQFKYVFVH
jgi:hypothetical protein